MNIEKFLRTVFFWRTLLVAAFVYIKCVCVSNYVCGFSYVSVRADADVLLHICVD